MDIEHEWRQGKDEVLKTGTVMSLQEEWTILLKTTTFQLLWMKNIFAKAVIGF